MITVSIMINGQPIFTRSAHRRTKRHAKGNQQAYLLDDNSVVYHDIDKGAIPLAIKMLKSIKEV